MASFNDMVDKFISSDGSFAHLNEFMDGTETAQPSQRTKSRIKIMKKDAKQKNEKT